MVTFDDFRKEWEGRRIDYDHVLGYQCVDLIRQYFLECFGLASGGGVPTAIAYWANTPADVLTKFIRVSDGSVQKGDVLILFTLGHTDYSGDGHIMIATGQGDPNSVEALEQNGMGSGTGLGSDAIRTRFVPRNRLAGVLRPIPVAPLPPAFQIVADYAPLRQMVVTRDTKRWKLNYRTFAEMEADPLGNAYVGDRVPAVSLAQHDNQEYYFLAADSSDTGWNVKDCTDYVAPVYVPPAAPAKPVLVTYYDIKPDVLMYYGSPEDAKQRRNAQGTKNKGQYILLKEDEQARQIVKKNTDRDIIWVNDFDNKVETPKPIVVATPAVVTLPVDAPPVHDEVVDASDNSVPVAMAPIADITPNKPKPQYQWINNHASQTMVSTNSIPITVHDLEGKYPDQQLPPNWRGEFSMYATVNGQTYYLPDKMRKAGWFFGINANMLRPVQQAKLDLNNDGRVNIADAMGIGGFIMTESKRAYTRLIAPVITDFKTEKAKQAVNRITTSIDGFKQSRRTKK